MFVTTANISIAGQRLPENRIVEILHGKSPTESEKIWLARSLSESSLDTLTGLIWHLHVQPSRLSDLFRLCHAERGDWDYD
jgi:hypothetical protein